ncbi:hypothetical protein SSX86_014926 [Deinandra increscens subsp. villosa]|uniref:RING-type domain-containing protein n=1 Tax=Deinandra increscens subsp. villosa TaxID=3103831 RepID=A0AAP0D3M6_9ASTR
MERAESRNDSEHVIDITSSNEASSYRSIVDRPVNQSNLSQNEDPPSTSVTTSAANVGISRNTSFSSHGQRSPLNSGYWICTEVFMVVSQIIAAIVVLSFSRHEHPEAPLFTWVVGYASGCVATLPLLFWRFYNSNRLSDQDTAQPGQSSTPSRLLATRFLTDVLLSASNEASSYRSIVDRPVNQSNLSQNEDPPSSSVTTSAANVGISRNTSFSSHGQRSPLNSGYWICTEVFMVVSQIIAAIVVLSFSRHEHPEAPLFTWVVGYASGCVAALPLLFWRFYNSNRLSDQDTAQPGQSSTPSRLLATRFLTDVLLSASDQASSIWSPMPPVVMWYHHGRIMSRLNPFFPQRWQILSIASSLMVIGFVKLNPMSRTRFKVFIEYFKMGLDCFFAVWFVVGNVWIFGGRSSLSDAPNLYRLCIVFLTLSCLGYAMPFILCATVCCCLPCIISVMGFREEQTHNRGATTESINSLPTYKFKVKKHKQSNDKKTDFIACEGGVVAAGTEKEHVISGEDAVCCICLGKYVNNDELRELHCLHFFHKVCVDKWLKINASCPLCKSQVGDCVSSSQTEVTAINVS